MPFFVAPYSAKDILFLGTSITAAGGYVTGVKALVQATPPYYSLITVSNLATGGSTSWYSLARIASVVEGLAPDVICLEHAVNDSATDFYARCAEATIRRIRTLLPNARLVFIATPQIGDVGVNDPTNLADAVKERWFTLCDRYGITKVDWADELVSLVAAGGNVATYLSDTVHPTAAGHTSIAGLLKTPLNTALGAGSMPAMPARLYDCEDYEAVPVWRNGTDNDGETGTGWSSDGTTRQSSTAEDTISWTFTGVSFGFVTGLAAGVVGVAIDGGDEITYDLAVYGSAINYGTELTNEAHTVVFRVVSGTVQIANFISI